ncbi:unnamed protein product [Plutella xylostella]|uniref:(diamondback moth) hypothetical protein n=1 Tax=Plutella xylostella TaxID=51655 RepID=A0A8S4GBV2_PLUXY|nr:unnamed protein product [Plutella xylostella]
MRMRTAPRGHRAAAPQRFIRIDIKCMFLWFQIARCEPRGDSASLPLEHRGGGGYGPRLAPRAGRRPLPLATPDSPKIKHLQVQCEKTHMRVNIEFDRPFYGMIFSKGFYSDPHCMHLTSQPGTGHLSATFEIFLNSCGMSSSGSHSWPTTARHAQRLLRGEHTIIVQYEPLRAGGVGPGAQAALHLVRLLREGRHLPTFQVDMLHAVTRQLSRRQPAVLDADPGGKGPGPPRCPAS